MATLEYWLWLSTAPVSAKARGALLRQYGDAERAYYAPLGDYKGIHGVAAGEAAILEKRDMSGVSRTLAACEEQNIRIVSFQDAAYPKRLRNVYDPPVVIYCKGTLPLVDECAPIAVIGTRRASVYGRRMGRELAYQIARCGGTVISLLTSGVDEEAARGALMAGGCCIGVLGTPHEQEQSPLAEELAMRGALISEYAPGTRPLRSFFRERNRIASGLSVGVVVVEAPERSGTRLFANEANEQGKEIFAVPGNADAANSVGTLELLKEGAKLVTCGWDVMCEFEALYPGQIVHREGSVFDRIPQAIPTATAPQTEKKAVDKEPDKGYIDLSKQLSSLTEVQLKIVTAIDKNGSHIDDIIEDTGLPAATVLAQLTILEIQGYVRREAGRRIALNTAKK